ncbi:MAG: class I SAM-dependent methyltransferase [Deltaproteobacteria bacterium]|nr:class I SAM-dependent methyltransferase [Deltaproteobacteria bacterium]
MAHAHHDTHNHPFVPALGWHALTRLYDPLIALTLRERAVKQQLVEQARLAPGCAVLDFGCGTGTLALLLKRHCPTARVVGIDVDPTVLELARRKILRAGLDIELRQGVFGADTFAPASFDRIVSTLVLHHLTRDEKLAVLRAMRTALRPGGELHVADFGPPHNALMRLAARVIGHVDGAGRVGDNLAGKLPALIAEAGFTEVATVGRRSTPFGTLAYLRASRGAA